MTRHRRLLGHQPLTGPVREGFGVLHVIGAAERSLAGLVHTWLLTNNGMALMGQQALPALKRGS